MPYTLNLSVILENSINTRLHISHAAQILLSLNPFFLSVLHNKNSLSSENSMKCWSNATLKVISMVPTMGFVVNTRVYGQRL